MPFLPLSLALVLAFGPVQSDNLDLRIVDGKISLHAQAVPLGRLLDLFDRVAGTRSTVPAALAGRIVSAQFQDFELDRAVRKVFEGLSLDYAVIEENRIIVTGASRRLAPGTRVPVVAASPAPAAAPNAPSQAEGGGLNPFQIAGPGAVVGATGDDEAEAPPAVFQTPFGPVVNPGAPPSGPGNPALPGVNRNVVPSAGDANAGFPPPSGISGESGQPSIFGNTAPPMMDRNSGSPPASDPQP